MQTKESLPTSPARGRAVAARRPAVSTARATAVPGTRSRPSGWASALAAAALAGCGGGVSIGFGYDGAWDDRPPSVSIAASATSVPAGQTVRLIAAASDESGIDSVGFYQLDGGLSRSLGRLGSPPYEITVTVPNDGRNVFSVYAQAFDRYGNRAQTAPLDITVTR